MPSLIPNRFLFKFEFPIHRASKPPRIDGELSKWDKRWLMPALCSLDGQEPFGDVYAAWHESGLYVGCRVSGKRRPARCDPQNFRQADNLRIMTDMRDTRGIRRATRFCRQFYLLPTGGGKKRDEPVAGAAMVARATENAPQIAPGHIPVAVKVTAGGWTLTAHLPADVLSGFDPEQNPRIGFFYMLEDGELGQQSLTVGDDLNWWVDPSTWPTGVLKE